MDELTHVVLFQNIINELQNENPEIFTNEFKEELRNMTKSAVEWEIKWGQTIIGDNIAGLSNEKIDKYIKWLSNNRLKRINLEPLYPEIIQNPLKWVEKWEDQNNTKQDFFQTTVTNYQKSNDIGLDEL